MRRRDFIEAIDDGVIAPPQILFYQQEEILNAIASDGSLSTLRWLELNSLVLISSEMFEVISGVAERRTQIINEFGETQRDMAICKVAEINNIDSDRDHCRVARLEIIDYYLNGDDLSVTDHRLLGKDPLYSEQPSALHGLKMILYRLASVPWFVKNADKAE